MNAGQMGETHSELEWPNGPQVPTVPRSPGSSLYLCTGHNGLREMTCLAKSQTNGSQWSWIPTSFHSLGIAFYYNVIIL